MQATARCIAPMHACFIPSDNGHVSYFTWVSHMFNVKAVIFYKWFIANELWWKFLRLTNIRLFHERVCEFVFACSNGAQVECFKQIKWSKISWHCPFNYTVCRLPPDVSPPCMHVSYRLTMVMFHTSHGFRICLMLRRSFSTNGLLPMNCDENF